MSKYELVHPTDIAVKPIISDDSITKMLQVKDSEFAYVGKGEVVLIGSGCSDCALCIGDIAYFDYRTAVDLTEQTGLIVMDAKSVLITERSINHVRQTGSKDRSVDDGGYPSPIGAAIGRCFADGALLGFDNRFTTPPGGEPDIRV